MKFVNASFPVRTIFVWSIMDFTLEIFLLITLEIMHFLSTNFKVATLAVFMY